MKNLKQLYALLCIFFLHAQNSFGADEGRNTMVIVYLKDVPLGHCPEGQNLFNFRNIFNVFFIENLKYKVLRHFHIPPQDQQYRLEADGKLISEEYLKDIIKENKQNNYGVKLFVSSSQNEPDHVGSY